MEHLSNLKSMADSVITDPNVVMEKTLAWSSSAMSQEISFHSVRDTFIAIGRSIEPKNIERVTASWFSSITSYVEANPIIFSLRLPSSIGGNAVQTYVNLPYLGAVPMDVFLFWSSAIIARASMFWKSRQERRGRGNNKGKSLGSPRHPPSPPVKATIVTGYKDKSLYKTIQECQDVKNSLRKTPDADLLRKEKKSQLTLQSIRTRIKGENSSDGYLGMTPTSLRDARRLLKETPPRQELWKSSD